MNYPTCKKPDRDAPKLVCGYPLPCTWHTAVIDVSIEPARVVIPVPSSAALRHRERLVEIARAVARERDELEDEE